MPSVVALPIPNSWHAVAFSDELGSGDTLARAVAQRELVIFRTRSGEPCAMDAHCPRLGAPILRDRRPTHSDEVEAAEAAASVRTQRKRTTWRFNRFM
jgi:nitrite reductase/ring-hydroxylating ferredoxin subunit